MVGGLWPGAETTSQPLFQVAQPEGERISVLQCGGWMDEGIGKELAALLNEGIALDGVGQHLLKQSHVLGLGLGVARLEQGQVGQQEGHHLLFGLLLPLADDGYSGNKDEH